MKKEVFAKATKKVKTKEIPVTDEMKKMVFINLSRKDVKIIAAREISDTSEEGDYSIVDMEGNVIFHLLITPYTIRLLQGDKLVGETHIVPIRNNMEDDIMIPYENMREICEKIYLTYSNYKSEIVKSKSVNTK